ncbi:hypothetical protein RB195_016420 [Necator americanus]|uniref:Dynamin-type G domain-containing protein n=1 Tax=Necator americanus TaxID=51031 RepID=A0ABR1C0D4_NECAM
MPRLSMKGPSIWDSPPCDGMCMKWSDFDQVIEHTYKTCIALLKDQRLLDSLRNSKFELVFSETFDACAPGIWEMIGIKNVVLVSALGMMPRLYEITGMSTIPSFMPAVLTPYSDKMTFMERMVNFNLEIFFLYYKYTLDYRFWKLFNDKHAGFPSFDHIYYEKTALIMTNANEFAETARPTTNMIQYIGGSNLHDPKPLPRDLSNLLDKNPTNVLLSMGSLIQSKDMPAWLKNDIIQAFASYPNITFIWKYESDDYRDVFEAHPNIQPMKWIPQIDLLADSRLSLFITHGGMNSMLEAMHHGKPMIVVPLFADQQMNAKTVERRGLGIVLARHHLNRETLTEAIKQTLENKVIARKSALVASILTGRPKQYRQDIARWAKIIIKHGQMDHLPLYSRNMNWIQKITSIYAMTNCFAGNYILIFKIFSAIWCNHKCSALRQFSSQRVILVCFSLAGSLIIAFYGIKMYGVTHAGAGDSARLNLSLKTGRRMNGEAEPLLRFAEAKKVLGEIYTDLGKHVDELDDVYRGIAIHSGGDTGDSNESIVPAEQAAEIELFRESIQTIMETFRRDNMKVVFFGRTSNGKSTTINAMLHAKILPQGMGHTTCCFLQVQGCNEDVGYLLLEDNSTRISIDQLSKIGHALSSDNSGLPAMGQDSLLRVFYPKGRGDGENRLLQNDVVILDSPGVDLSPEFDSWIDKHCLDADVFVLVLNAESTLTQAEKSFFHRVAKKLSKPNVFILNNRWDASASESEHVEDVRQQHLTRFRQFLVNELEVATDRDVKDRIFFVSSREVLDSRLKARGLIKTPYQMEGHQVRAMEFEMFERQFEQCISRAAIRTKFEAHNRRANEIIARMRANVDVVHAAASKAKQILEQSLQHSTQVFNDCRMNFAQFERAYREQTERLRAEVHLKVSADFSEEIMRLEAIIDRFNMPFLDTSQGIIEYKKALAEFTDKCVSSDLEARCTGGLMSRIWNLENDMFQYVTKILAEPYQHKLEEVWKYRAPFKFSICVDAPALTKDFHEDLEFRFTFGLSAIIRRIIAYRSGQPVTAIQTNLLTPMALRNAGRSNADLHNEAMQKAVEENAMMTQMVLTSASYLANGSIGLLVVGGIVYRAVGWRVIAVTAAAYGGLYIWERMRWNSHAKEQHLKEQFRSHLAARMQQVGAAHTTHCETQAMREMDQVFDGLRATVAGVHREMKEELDKSKKEIENVDGTLKSLVTIKGKTAFLLRSLEQFATSFLRTDSPSP